MDHPRKGEVEEYACKVQGYEPGEGWVLEFVEEVLVVVGELEPPIIMIFERLHLDQPW